MIDENINLRVSLSSLFPLLLWMVDYLIQIEDETQRCVMNDLR